jgi:uncharacterized protein (DUF362 family)
MKNLEEIISNLKVSIYHEPGVIYPETPPYDPNIAYPEYFLKNVSIRKNRVYNAVRNTLFLLGLDKNNFDTPQWNPFKDIIKPTNIVVIKPNFVLSKHDNGGDLFSIITHPSIIRTVVDYVYIALAGKGKIIIADAPQMDCDFKELLKITNLETIKKLYKKELNFDIEIYDLRNFWLDKKGDPENIYSINRHKLPGDPLSGVLVNLGKESLFYGVKNYKKYYGADYNREETIKHHHHDIQEYLISKTILSADAIISIPKLKVHKKIGVTLNIKGLVGICVNKNYLVHYTLGTPSEGGDQFPDNVLNLREKIKVKIKRWCYDCFLSKKNPKADFLYRAIINIGKLFLKPLEFKLDKKKSILDAGNWYGNDSTWRMVVDLLRIFIYADKEGNLQNTPIRKIFSLVDGIIGGEGEGPLTPESKKCGLIVAGFNLCAVDLVCVRLMGFDYKKTKILNYISEQKDLFKIDISKIKVISNENYKELFNKKNKSKYFNFEPPTGWKGFIEIY